jgi:hypothetical protein
VLRKLAYPLFRPILRAIFYSTEKKLRELPQPKDSPFIRLDGAAPDRVLLFGSGPAMGYGVTSNELALPGQLARELAVQTARGVELDAVVSPEITIQDSVRRLAHENLWRYDSLVLTIGINNALLLTSVRTWRAGLRAVLTHVSQHAPKHTSVFVVEIPPIHTFDALARLTGWLAEHHVEALNRETQRTLREYPRVQFVPCDNSGRPDDVRFRTVDTYRIWAQMIAKPLSEKLTAGHRGSGAAR